MSEKWIDLAYKQQAEIERLNGVVREWERDMKGTLNSLEAERQKAAKLLAALEAGQSRGWVHNAGITQDIEALRAIALEQADWWNNVAWPLIKTLKGKVA